MFLMPRLQHNLNDFDVSYVKAAEITSTLNTGTILTLNSARKETPTGI
jgi:hypothetical protein